MKAIDIIKALPLEEEVKTKVLEMYMSFTPGQKISVDKLAWDAYFLMYDEKLKKNLGTEYEEIRKRDEKMAEDFYKNALEKTDKEMNLEFKESVSEHDLEAARKAMELIVREIQAAKKSN